MQYPQNESLFPVDDQYMVGSDLLVKPVTSPGVVETTVKFPTDDVWYDAEQLTEVYRSGAFQGSASFAEVKVPSDIDTIPVFQRGGSIIARKLRLRRSSLLMKTDPYTLYVALSASKTAKGSLYSDDEATFDHERKEEYIVSEFSADFNPKVAVIQNKATPGKGFEGLLTSMAGSNMIERIMIMGVEKAPTSIDVGGEALGFTYDRNTKVLTIRKPDVSSVIDWQIKITF